MVYLYHVIHSEAASGEAEADTGPRLDPEDLLHIYRQLELLPLADLDLFSGTQARVGSMPPSVGGLLVELLTEFPVAAADNALEIILVRWWHQLGMRFMVSSKAQCD